MTNTRDIRFATITARFLGHDGMAFGHFKTCGHHRADCPAIKPDSIRLNLPTEEDERRWGFEPTLNGYCTAAEWFDGEAQYDAPIVCNVCCAPNGEPLHETPCRCGAYDRCWGVRVEGARSVRDLHRAYND